MTQPDDELKRLYAEANALDERRPASRVRAAVLAHAQMVLDAKAAPHARTEAHAKAVPPRTPGVANLPSWKAALAASVLLVPLIGILVSRDPRQVSGDDRVALVAAPQSAPAVVAQPSDQTVVRQAESAGVAAVDANANANAVAGAGAGAGAGRAKAVVQPLRSRAEVLVARADKAMASAPEAVAGARLPSQEARVAAQTGPDVTLATATPSGESFPEPSRGSDAAVAYAPPTRPLFAAPAAAAPAPAQTAVAAAGTLARMDPPALDAAQSSAKRTSTAGAASADASEVKASIFQAVAAGNVSAMEGLVLRGASVNARDAAGRTALIVAVLAAQEAMVVRLLALGATPGLLDREGLTALQHARNLGHARIVSLLERRD